MYFDFYALNLLTNRIKNYIYQKNCSEGDTMIYCNLTQRESDVVTLKKQGMGDREVAAALHISYSTVRSYINRALIKLNCSNTYHLISIAKKNKK